MRVRSVLSVSVCVALVACTASAPEPVSPEQPKPFYKTLETPPAPVLSAEQALDTFVIAPGFSIELVAPEPLVEDPVAIDWDEDGHLYVAEMRAFMTDLAGSGEERPIGSVVRLADDDGDGVMDRREVMLDGLVLPRAIRIVNEGLLVGEMGKLWLCPTASGWSQDIDCSRKTLLGEYGEHQGSVEHAENGLLPGIDNWLYSAKSGRRLKIRGGALIEEPTVFRGQWGITQDDSGRLYYNTNSNLLLGDYFDGQAIVEAGNRSGAGLNQRISSDDEAFAIRVNPGVNRAYVPGVLRADGRLKNVTSASGMVVYRGGRHAADDPDVFVAEPAANVVAALKLAESGVQVKAEHRLYPDDKWGQRDFLASTDERFRPVDVVNGPDGALYVVDFYRGVIQDHVFISEELKAQARQRGLERPVGMGRIWRVEKQGTEPAMPLPDWRALNTQQLADQLSAPDIWRRATAQRLLLRSTADDVANVLQKLVRRSASPQAAVHALWTLEGRGELTEEILAAALNRGGRVAEATLLAGGDQLTLSTVQGVLDSATANSRLYLYALGAIRHVTDDAEAVDLLAGVLTDHADDQHVRAFVQAALRGRERDMVAGLLSAGSWTPELEAKSAFLGALAQQLFRAEGAGASGLLDDVTAMSTSHLWAQKALLDGLFETTREPGFKRAELVGSHKIFATDDEALWPSVSRARRGFTWPGDTLASHAKPLTPAQLARMEKGETFYRTSCANCHGEDGAGIGAVGPPLKDSPWVVDAPERLARIVLHGLQGPIDVLGEQWNSAMPAHGNYPGFDDEVASGLLTYLRRSWGHGARAIDPQFITDVRTETQDRSTLWTADELTAIDINTHFRKYEGRYGHPSRAMKFVYDGQQLTIQSGIFNGALTETREDHFLFAPRNLKFEFVLDDDGNVSGVMLHTGDANMVMPRLPS